MAKYVYLAGPIRGLTFQGANQWRTEFAASVYPCITVSPMRGKDNLDREDAIRDDYKDNLDANARATLSRDTFDVRNCDMLIANLLGAYEVSIGTMIELGMAHTLHKPIGIVIEPYGNPNEHAWLDQICAFRTPDLDQAARQVIKYLSAYK